MTTRYVMDASIVVQRFIVDRFTPQVQVLFSQLQTGIDTTTSLTNWF